MKLVIGMAIVTFALCWLITFVTAGIGGDCYNRRVAWFPVENYTGWHGDVRCYKGNVVDYR